MGAPYTLIGCQNECQMVAPWFGASQVYLTTVHIRWDLDPILYPTFFWSCVKNVLEQLLTVIHIDIKSL